MVRLNLFRPLAHDRPPMDEVMEEEPYKDPQWLHLSVVYQFYLDLVRWNAYVAVGVRCAVKGVASRRSLAVVMQVSYDIDLTMKKKVVDASFIEQLVPLFNSQDGRERDMLKVRTHTRTACAVPRPDLMACAQQTVVHRTYSKLTQRRSLIRRCICNVFYEVSCGERLGGMWGIFANLVCCAWRHSSCMRRWSTTASQRCLRS